METSEDDDLLSPVVPASRIRDGVTGIIRTRHAARGSTARATAGRTASVRAKRTRRSGKTMRS
ncbi:hypothetical protein LIY60_24170, partial [Escherichia coli]|nr:hypothetical protein [Escherichia coli]